MASQVNEYQGAGLFGFVVSQNMTANNDLALFSRVDVAKWRDVAAIGGS